MILHRHPLKNIAGALLGAALLVVTSPLALAAEPPVEPHEDPEAARPVFSGISLFNYYTGALDFVLQIDPANVEARLIKMPFANVPESLEGTTQNFAGAGMTVSQQIFEIDKNLNEFRKLRASFRLREATELADQISGFISLAYSQVDQLEQATIRTGTELNVSSAPEGSGLRRSYEVVLDRIEKIRDLLALYEELLKSANLTLEELLKSAGLTRENLLESAGFAPEQISQSASLTLEEVLKSKGLTVEELLKSSGLTLEELLKLSELADLLKPTSLTLEIQPAEAFVGENIGFEGLLTSGNTPLAGREIVILLDSSRHVAATTDASGHYQGVLTVPYRYLPEMRLQALYQPQDKDVGVYLAALSPVVILKVLFYQTDLKLRLQDKPYPGLDTAIAGTFSYGDAPPLNERRIEIYLDDVFVAETTTQDLTFSRKIPIAPDIELGEHVIVFFVAAAGKYSPTAPRDILNVKKAVPVLDLDMPGTAIIPGSVRLKGRLHSEIGPLNGASLRIGLDKSEVEAASNADGTFETSIKTPFGFGLIGSQDLGIRILPQEPWHDSLVVTRPILVINVINLSGIALVLIVLGIYLPGILRRKLGELPRRAAKPAPAPAAVELAPTYSESVTVPVTVNKDAAATDGPPGEPRDIIFYWYRLAVRLLQKITRVLLGPTQTLREFARDNSARLGPLARYFTELTYAVERLLYSRHTATEQDAEQSKVLAHTLEEGLKDEAV